eukprot:5372543-Alexandrium_andersonii.AAC.1
MDALLEVPHLLVDGGDLALDALGDGGALLLRAPDGLELAAAGSIQSLYRRTRFSDGAPLSLELGPSLRNQTVNGRCLLYTSPSPRD